MVRIKPWAPWVMADCYKNRDRNIIKTTFQPPAKTETQIKRQEEEKDQYPTTPKHSLPKRHENS
jgi:hypothetical protein